MISTNLSHNELILFIRLQLIFFTTALMFNPVDPVYVVVTLALPESLAQDVSPDISPKSTLGNKSALILGITVTGLMVTFDPSGQLRDGGEPWRHRYGGVSDGFRP